MSKITFVPIIIYECGKVKFAYHKARIINIYNVNGYFIVTGRQFIDILDQGVEEKQKQYIM